MKQGSAEWLQARTGFITASRFADVLAKTRNGEAASRKNYKAELIAERLTGIPYPQYVNQAMLFGTEWEPFARAAYEAKTGNTVQEVGFIKHDSLQAGASPDGLIGLDGGIEIKVPNTATHIETLLKGMTPDHLPQIQGGMWITGRQWWDFASYDPRMPEHLQLYVERVLRDDAYIERLEAEVIAFNSEIDEMLVRLEAIG